MAVSQSMMDTERKKKILVKCVLVAQSCLTVCNPMDCSPPGSSVHGILQARILEWVAVSFSRGIFPNTGIKPMPPALAGRFLTAKPPGKSTNDSPSGTVLVKLSRDLIFHPHRSEQVLLSFSLPLRMVSVGSSSEQTVHIFLKETRLNEVV